MKALRRLVAQFRHSYHDILVKTQATAAAAVAPTDVVTKDVKPYETIPGPKGICNWTRFGAMLYFKPFTNFEPSTIHLLFDHLHDKYGPVVKARMGKWTVYIEDPADIETVFRNEGRMPIRPLPHLHVHYSKTRGIIPGLASMQNEEWYTLRKAVNAKLMKPNSALRYLDAQNEVADDLVRKLTHHNFTPDELQTVFSKYASESICVVAFNKRQGLLDSDMDKQVDEFFNNIGLFFDLFMKGFHAPPLYFGLFETPLYKQYSKVVDYIRERVGVLLCEAIEDLKQKEKMGLLNEEEPNFLLSLLGHGTFGMAEIEMIVLDLFIAGTDSTAKNLQVFLYNIARHPEEQQKLFEEIHSVMGDSGPLTEDHLGKLGYLKACLKESFRFVYPTASGTGRFIPKDLVLGGYNVPAGTLIVMSNQRTVRNKKYFDRPDEFIPERWLRDEHGNRQRMIPPMTLLPFGFGPRNCLGRRFAEQEIYLAAVKLIQKFKIELEPDHEDMEVEYFTFVSPTRPVRFKFTRR
ncbi:probable cytochrome P450 CYP44 [Haliotis rubra]|uniref:probable cytochrome P450 CYP44 n=1 Tax=Haliotis rubra TaxID=36100 RepID=UPI001EE600A1|nr:probable cytochrome P450 CYP44 [Haliotis rubra]